MSDECVFMHERTTRASWLLSSAGQFCAGLLWKIIASPYSPDTSTLRTAKALQRAVLALYSSMAHKVPAVVLTTMFWL